MFMPRGQYGTVPQEESLGEMYRNVPEYRKRERRAKALRKRREGMQAAEDKDTPLGAVSEGSHGGLYSIQGSYIPNYSGLANKAIGALGGIYADREGGELEKAEGSFDTLQSEELIKNADLLDRRRRARQLRGDYGYSRY